MDRRELDGLDRQRMTFLSRALPLPLAGRLYYAAVATAALSAGDARVRARRRGATSSWLTFVALAASAATAQVFIVRTGRSHGFHTAIVFVTAGALLLPPELVALMVVIQHVPEWLKERYPAYIQTFNICELRARRARGLGGCGSQRDRAAFLGNDARAAAAGVAAGALLVLVNHVLLAPMLRLARGVSFADSGLFSVESLSSDIVLAGLGVVLAMVWLSNIWLVPAIVAPLVISYRSIRLLGRARDSEERFRTILEAAPIGMIVRDLDGQIISTNPAFERMVGYSSDELEQIEPGEAVRGERERAASRSTASSRRTAASAGAASTSPSCATPASGRSSCSRWCRT